MLGAALMLALVGALAVAPVAQAEKLTRRTAAKAVKRVVRERDQGREIQVFCNTPRRNRVACQVGFMTRTSVCTDSRVRVVRARSGRLSVQGYKASCVEFEPERR